MFVSYYVCFANAPRVLECRWDDDVGAFWEFSTRKILVLIDWNYLGSRLCSGTSRKKMNQHVAPEICRSMWPLLYVSSELQHTCAQLTTMASVVVVCHTAMSVGNDHVEARRLIMDALATTEKELERFESAEYFIRAVCCAVNLRARHWSI